MDKLKLVLEQKFWILAGIAALLPPVGWWMATEDFAAKSIQRRQILETAFKEAKPEKSPNDKWIHGAKQVNEELKVLVDQSHQRLFERQRDSMTWPEQVQKVLDDGKVKDHGEISGEGRRYWVNRYDPEWQSIVNIVEPFDTLKGSGNVLLERDPENQNASVIPKTNTDQWKRTFLFTSAQMWDAQEDLWLLRSLMQAIARVNKGATEIGNARIKMISELVLRGGSRADLAARRSSATQTDQGGPAAAQRPGGGPRRPFVLLGPPKFDPDDVFGAAPEIVQTGGAGAGLMRGRREDRDDNRRRNESEFARYYDSVPGKWRSRGFVLHVVMDQREIPTLLGELSDSPFPVEIRYVQSFKYDPHNISGILTTLGANQPLNALSNMAAGQVSDSEKKIQEQLRLAFNQNYLFDVIVAGLLTIYDEPAVKTVAAVGAKASATPAANSAPPPGAQRAASGPVQPGPAGAAPASNTRAPAPPATGPAKSPAAGGVSPTAAKPPAAATATSPGSASPAVPKSAGPKPAVK